MSYHRTVTRVQQFTALPANAGHHVATQERQQRKGPLHLRPEYHSGKYQLLHRARWLGNPQATAGSGCGS